jgi:hypothetical protein
VKDIVNRDLVRRVFQSTEKIPWETQIKQNREVTQRARKQFPAQGVRK